MATISYIYPINYDINKSNRLIRILKINPIDLIRNFFVSKLLKSQDKLILAIKEALQNIENEDVSMQGLRNIQKAKKILLKNRTVLDNINYFDNEELKEKVKLSYKLLSKLERIVKKEVYKDTKIPISSNELNFNRALALKSKSAIQSRLINDLS